MWKEREMKNWQMPRKEDRKCDGRTALREMRKEWEENGEQQQETGVVTADRERSERKARKEKMKSM